MTPERRPVQGREGTAEEGEGALARHRRALFFVLGWIFFGLGVAGALLPVLPTTPFMLLALWAFARSSGRFHDWLYHHRIFGPSLQRWDRERVIPPWVKAFAIGSMVASFAWVALHVRPPWWALAAMGAVMLAGVAFLASVPSRPREAAVPPSGDGADGA
jgi:uncharacterized protein